MNIIADANIAALNYFFADVSPNLMAMSGRCITQQDLTHCQALLVRSVTQVNATLLANTPVGFVGSATIGTDHVNTQFLDEQGIVFANAAGCSKHSVAQYVLTAILTLHPTYARQPIKLGIIGLGNIGSTLARYAQFFGWQVLGYDPLLPASASNNCELATLYQNADVISLHVPLTTAKQSQYPTYRLIDTAALEQMPVDTLLINSARGQVIDEADLLANIKKTNRQVVLDVFFNEPTLSRELLDNITLVTPHIAGYTLEGKLRGTQLVYEAFCQWQSRPNDKNFYTQLPDITPRFTQQSNPNATPITQLVNQLTHLYDIKTDDNQLRALATASGVAGADFDALRKNYPLRREWQAYGFNLKTP